MNYGVERFPMHDTGLGRDVGYESDAAMVEAVRAERAAMPDGPGACIEDFEREMAREFLFGRP